MYLETRSLSTSHANIDERLRGALRDAEWSLLTRLCKQALRKDRRHLLAHRLLGFSLAEQGLIEAAISAYQQGQAQWPDDAELLINYSNVLLKNARSIEATPLLKAACLLRPTHAACWLAYAQCCYDTRKNEEGMAAALKATELATTPAEHLAALTQRAIHRRELGQVREAVQDCEAALSLCPIDLANHTNRLLFMLADPDVEAHTITKAAREYAAAFEAPLRSEWPKFGDQALSQPWKRLRIGFISPDFRMHAVMYSAEGLLAQLDRRQFEVYAFYLYPNDDHVTKRVQRHADHFIRLHGMSAQLQADSIRSNGIDILIDLAGHTGHNGLQAMARRAAPVQVSWLGYPATTGLDAMDYKFTDEVTDPSDASDQYSEELYRLPTLFACYRPMSRNPLWRYQPAYQVRPTPALTKGYITFGSCNNLGKLTDNVLTLWGQLLARIPTAHLLIEGRNLDQPDFANAYRQRCQQLGIDILRLELVARDNSWQYLTYHDIDVALDPFPLTGGTTSFDVLWMGVPLVSMIGRSFRSRMGTGILTHLGRTEWLATDEDQYIRIANMLAEDPYKLNALRLGLRTELEHSAVMREDLYNLHFGEGLRVMWHQWLARMQHPDDPTAQTRQIKTWSEQCPQHWDTPATPGVGLAPGDRVSLMEAHQRLQALLDKAKAKPQRAYSPDGRIEQRQWVEVTELAETVLCAVPHDAMALACLAEVEMAHGHSEFAMTYLRYAARSMGNA